MVRGEERLIPGARVSVLVRALHPTSVVAAHLADPLGDVDGRKRLEGNVLRVEERSIRGDMKHCAVLDVLGAGLPEVHAAIGSVKYIAGTSVEATLSVGEVPSPQQTPPAESMPSIEPEATVATEQRPQTPSELEMNDTLFAAIGADLNDDDGNDDGNTESEQATGPLTDPWARYHGYTYAPNWQDVVIDERANVQSKSARLIDYTPKEHTTVFMLFKRFMPVHWLETELIPATNAIDRTLDLSVGEFWVYLGIRFGMALYSSMPTEEFFKTDEHRNGKMFTMTCYNSIMSGKRFKKIASALRICREVNERSYWG